MKKLFVIGSGGFSKQVIEIIETTQKTMGELQLVGIIDDNIDKHGQKVLGYEIIGDISYLDKLSKSERVYAVIAISNGIVKKRIAKQLVNVNWVNLIHPSVIMSDHNAIGQGNIICAGTIINPDCRIGNHCHLNIGVTLGHDVLMNDNVTVMPGANISGNTTIGNQVLIGSGAVIIQGLTMEDNSVLGAGAVLTRNTVESNTYIGVPAKKL